MQIFFINNFLDVKWLKIWYVVLNNLWRFSKSFTSPISMQFYNHRLIIALHGETGGQNIILGFKTISLQLWMK